jgi:hypothetical protein
MRGNIPIRMTYPGISSATDQVVSIANEIESRMPNTPYEPLDLAHRWDEQTDEVQIDQIGTDIDEISDDEIYRSGIGEFEEEGVEAIAFYKSFRCRDKNPAKGYWGIFVIKPRFNALVQDMHIETGIPVSACHRQTLHFLYCHELFHYKVDSTCLQLEALVQQPIYRTYRRSVSQAPVSQWFEEAAANCYGLSGLDVFREDPSYVHGFNFLIDLVRNSPGAYSLGATRDIKSLVGERTAMIEQIFRHLFNVNRIASISGQHTEAERLAVDRGLHDFLMSGYKQSPPRDRKLSSRLDLFNCPVQWLTWQKNGLVVAFPNTIPLREAREDFLKGYLSGKPVRHTDHGYVEIDNGERVKVPGTHSEQKDLKVGEFKNIIKKSGMTVKGFWLERERTRRWKNNCPRDKVLPSLSP